ncbi:MAG: hypothetical protein WB005_09565, partial [Pseudolabrys sp.]
MTVGVKRTAAALAVTYWMGRGRTALNRSVMAPLRDASGHVQGVWAKHACADLEGSSRWAAGIGWKTSTRPARLTKTRWGLA